MGQTGAYAGFGAMRLAARPRVAPTHGLSFLACVSGLVTIDSQAPEGGAKAP